MSDSNVPVAAPSALVSQVASNGLEGPGAPNPHVGLQMPLEGTTGTLEVASEVKGRSRKLAPDAIQRIFDCWVVVTGRNPARCRLNNKRLQKINARANEGYTEEDMTLAIKGVMESSFHRGENETGTKYTDLVTILRDGNQVEKFSELFESGGERGPSDATDKAFAMMGAQSEGNGVDDWPSSWSRS